MTTAYHPQADGQSERTNRTIEIMIRTYVFELMERHQESNWLRLLPIIELEHNLTMNVSTGFAPFDLLYAARPRRPMERAILQAKRDEAPQKDALSLVDDLERRRKVARIAIKRAQKFQKKYYDLNHSPLPEFSVGEKVVLLPFEKARKLDRHGRCVYIREKVSPLAYRIKVPPNSEMHDVVSINFLKKYYRRKTDEAEREHSEGEESVDLEEPRGIEEVEAVIGERLLSGRKEFLVKWKDFDEKDMSWVAEDEMGSAQEKLAEWKALRG